jgi:hypothetical protein
MSLSMDMVKRPNDVREQRGPAATDVRTATDLDGWSPSAPRNCSATS